MYWKNENVKLKKGDAFHFYGDSALFFRENTEKTAAVRLCPGRWERGVSRLGFSAVIFRKRK